ncbi:hypothetical protein STEG23_021336 [Scotinomys teguina]
MPMVRVATKAHVEVGSLYYHLKPHVGHAAAGSHTDLSGLCRHLREAMLIYRPELPLRAMSGSVVLLQPGYRVEPVTHAPTDCRDQEGYFCHDMDDGKRTVEKRHERPL